MTTVLYINFNMNCVSTIMEGEDDLDYALEKVLLDNVTESKTKMDITIKPVSFTSNIVDYPKSSLSVRCEVSMPDSIAELDDENFINKSSQVIKDFIEYLENRINEVLDTDDTFGYMPDANIIYKDEYFYIQLGYHQKELEIYTKPVVVQIDQDEDDLAEDLYASIH